MMKDRQMEGQTDRKTDRQTDRQTADRQTCKERVIQTDRQNE